MKQLIKIIIPLICITTFSSCLRNSNDNNSKFVLINYRYGLDNELNTFDDTFIKNVIGHGNIKIKLYFSNSEQDEIINKALRIGFFKIPDTLNVNDQFAGRFNDSEIVKEKIQSLRIKYKNLDKKIIWRGMLPYNNPEAQGLAELTFLIRKIIKAKPVYKSLPAINSGNIQYYFRIVKFLFR